MTSGHQQALCSQAGYVSGLQQPSNKQLLQAGVLTTLLQQQAVKCSSARAKCHIHTTL
jgi:hypothetical protein